MAALSVTAALPQGQRSRHCSPAWESSTATAASLKRHDDAPDTRKAPLSRLCNSSLQAGCSFRGAFAVRARTRTSLIDLSLVALALPALFPPLGAALLPAGSAVT
jgi:hypothetical protein